MSRNFISKLSVLHRDFLMYLPETRVKSAIEACNSGTGFLRGRTGVNQHSNARYCGDQGPVGKLRSHGEFKAYYLFLRLTRQVGKLKDIEVHAAEGGFHSIRNSCWILRPMSGFPGIEFLMDKHEPLGRFVGIVKPIAGGIFKLRMTSLHVFYDIPGGPIAFNQGGNIYLNLRFFEEWRECNFVP